MEPITLLELNGRVKSAIQFEMPDAYWVQAEISSISPSGQGHCYLELVQKDATGRNFLAKAKANIWRGTWLRLKPYFEEQTGESLKVGMKVLLQVTVTFHEVYGYSLVVQDIDPTYTMGDMARRRKEILEQLAKDGVIGLNQELEIPALPNRIAVISSATAAGWGDFRDQLANNIYGFQFYVKLFPALMQGDDVERSVIQALNAVAERRDDFDVVIIIRGGGAVSELSCFDSYNLAFNIANFPLPVITGIGHERDDTVADVVAHTKVKTPTAAAEFIINRVFDTAQELESLTRRMTESISGRMNAENVRIERLSQKLPSLFAVLKTRQEQILETIWIKSVNGVRNMLTAQTHKLELVDKTLAAADPTVILKRGYSLTRLNGRTVKGASDLKKGDRLTTVFKDGSVESEII
ncbi:MAG: exodeoxyribonuclease VII large subunit [Bacteroidaceae bacterium]|nr:exodeoxyribonuclease VII large subunit [Bacteroidaceae bacterium]MBR4794769.1 exodeoxyribonuclease VII large subunit [Bacteroidaceae bacterium]